MPSAAASNSCSSRRGRAQPVRSVMASSELPTVRSFDVPVVTAAQPASVAAPDEGPPPRMASGKLDSIYNELPPFREATTRSVTLEVI